MKKLALLILAIVAIGSLALSSAQAQPTKPGGRSEEIRTMKIAFFTDALKLTPAESERFWPIYNQYWDERRTIGHRRRDLFKAVKEGTATDKQLDEIVAVMDLEKKLTVKYIAEFKKVIPVDKVAKLFIADEDFKGYLIRLTAGGERPR